MNVLSVTSPSVMNFVGDAQVDDDQKVFYQCLSGFPQSFSARGFDVKVLGVKDLTAHGLVQKLLTVHA